jgi:glyoxylase-like metal-dependent hydrolase (beta-lactamase superfamily II)
MSAASLHGAPARYDAGLKELGTDVWAWLQPNGGLGESNAGLVRGEGESLLVDTLWDLRLTARMLAQMAPVCEQAPIKRIFNTHADGDHCWGNQLLAGAEVLGSEACAEDMRGEDPRGVRMLRRAASIAGPVLAHAPRSLPGVEQGAGLGAFASLLAPFDFDGIELCPPTRTFQGSLELEVGGRTVELFEVGPAHTPGDAIAHVPDASTVFAADVMFVGVAPIMWSGPVENWQASLKRIVELAPQVVVPGHGPVCGLDGVQVMSDYWAFVAPAVRERLADGASPEQAARDVIASPEYEQQPFGEWEGPERLVVSADTIARNDRGEVGRPGDVARIGLLSAMGRLAGERASASG